MIARRPAVAAVATAVLACMLAQLPGAAQNAGHQRHPYTIPHTLRYATASEPGSLNPLLRQEFVLSLLAQLTMAYLFRYNQENRPVPELAVALPTQKNGGISKDGKTITYHLRKGVVWSDGVPFTSKDVAFTWKVVMDSRNNITSRTGWDFITSVDTPDELTAIFRLSRPYGSYVPTYFGTGGANPCILPAHLFKDTQINEAPYNSLPVGIGPFKYLKWARGAEIELVANDRYWRGKPKLEKIVYKLIPDRNTVLTQLATHELDMWVAATAPYWDRIRALPNVTAIKKAGSFFDHLDFNMTNPILKERAVREALRLGIDRQRMNDTIYHGVAVLQESMLSPVSPLADTSIPLVPYDPARAKVLLERAGWKMGADGVRQKNGTRLAFTFVLGSGAEDNDQAVELMRAWWKELGVELNVRHYTPPMMFATYQEGGIIYTGKFDITQFAWLPPADGNFTNLYATKQIPPHGQNVPRYSNPKVDAALNRFEQTYDEEERKRIDSFVMRQIVSDVPTVVLRIREDIYGYNDDLQNFNPNATTPFDDMLNVDI